MIQPRPYQTEALQKILGAWEKGVTRQLISLPTGCGKTIIFGMAAEALRVRTLVLAHREELLFQAARKIRLIYPDAGIGILKAGDHSGLSADICIASVQTAARHTDELARRDYRLLICDEAHHAVSPSYMRIFDALGFLLNERDRLLLGVTATAFRSDRTGLENLFEQIVFERSILAMMRAGYLCDVRGLSVRTGTDISSVHTRAGDLAIDELTTLIDTPERNALVAETYICHGEKRRGVVFGVRVEHALNLARAFQERGIPCEAVYGSMPAEERRDILRRYERRELSVLTNVGVLTEGWDVPDTDIIMMARPTKSKGLYIQCVGRGLRPAPGKGDCLLIDFVDVAKRHRLCSFGTLAGGPLITPEKGHTLLEAVREAEEREAARSKARQARLTHEMERFELFERSRFVWQTVYEQAAPDMFPEALEAHYKLNIMGSLSLWCRAVPGGYSPLRVSAKGEVTPLSDGALPLDYAIGVCEDYARRLDQEGTSLKDARWRSDEATEKQLRTLKSMGVKIDRNISKGEASELLSRKFGELATEAQVWFIKRNKLHPNPGFLTKYEAGKLIGQFKKKHAR